MFPWTGISASSRLNLEAQVYKSKEEALLKREGKFEAPVNRRTAGIDVSQIRNAGVEERNKRDVEQLEVHFPNETDSMPKPLGSTCDCHTLPLNPIGPSDKRSSCAKKRKHHTMPH